MLSCFDLSDSAVLFFITSSHTIHTLIFKLNSHTLCLQIFSPEDELYLLQLLWLTANRRPDSSVGYSTQIEHYIVLHNNLPHWNHIQSSIYISASLQSVQEIWKYSVITTSDFMGGRNFQWDECFWMMIPVWCFSSPLFLRILRYC